MQALLKVVGGKNDGKTVKITVPEFIIGRGERAHLRPNSDMVSRMHCAIRLKNGKVEIEDLGSRNGSFVNDEQLSGIHFAQSGDRLRIGRLNFEVIIDPSQAGIKKPPVKDIAEAAARTVEKLKPENSEKFEDSINDWLCEPDDRPLDRSSGSSETVQFSIEDIDAIIGNAEAAARKAKADAAAGVNSDSKVGDPEEEDDGSTSKKKKKKEFGKLPSLPKFSHDDSTSAAGDVLKKFFNRR